MVHKIIVDVIGAEPRQLFVKETVEGGVAAYKVLRKFCRNIDFVPYTVPLEYLSYGSFASAVNICGIKIIDACTICFHDLPLGFIDVYLSAFFHKAHTPESKHRKLVPVFVFSVFHILCTSFSMPL